MAGARPLAIAGDETETFSGSISLSLAGAFVAKSAIRCFCASNVWRKRLATWRASSAVKGFGGCLGCSTAGLSDLSITGKNRSSGESDDGIETVEVWAWLVVSASDITRAVKAWNSIPWRSTPFTVQRLLRIEASRNTDESFLMVWCR